MSQIFEILTWRDFGPIRQWSGNFPPGFFTPFWRPAAGNYESVFLIVVRPIGAFDRRATKIYVRSF